MSSQLSIWRCIPKRLEKAIESVEYRTYAEEGDPKYWIYLNAGWVAYDGGEDCHIIYEHTIKDLKASIKTIRRID